MPSKHSPEKLAERRLRACRRGYLQHRSAGLQHIEVKSVVAEKIKTMAASLDVHLEHQRIAGRPYHYARHATLAAKDTIGAESTRRALHLHQPIDANTIYLGQTPLKIPPLA